MGGRRWERWERWEDDLIVEAATGNRMLGLTQTALGDIEAARDAVDRQDGYRRRLVAVADRTGRSYNSVKQRAYRLGKRSSRPREPAQPHPPRSA